MKFSIVFLLCTILALLAVSTNAHIPRAVCFRKTQKCCFRFRRCGKVVRKIPIRERCDYKDCKRKCRRVCRPRCKPVHTTVRREVCDYKPVRVCRKVRVERRRKWVLEEKCSFERQRRCRTEYKRVTKDECRRVCDQKCRIPCRRVKAICSYFRIFHYPKFCPVLKCDPQVHDGPRVTPRDVVSPKGTFVGATKPIRTADRRKNDRRKN